MSNLLATIVTGALAPFPDMIVVGRVDGEAELAAQIRSAQADVVMMTASEPDRAADFEALLREFPMLKVVAIRAGGDRGCLHELRVYSLPLAELSAEGLNTALHAVSAPQ
jgi:hypothetical protein